MTQTADSARVSQQSQPSASALNVARCRAIAAHETREEIRGPDTLAELFIGAEGRQSLTDPAMHAVILQKLYAFSPGSYEYFIARTAYLDAVVQQALRDNAPQIVMLGAGYDTRACRFRDLIRETRIFELDSAATQQHKRALLDEAHVVAPPQLTYLALDFTTDSIADVLAGAGYTTDQQTLFIWEGVTYYLPPQAVDATLAFVRSQSPAGSVICFDYMLPVTELEGRFGAQQARDAMQSIYAAEPLQFDLAPEQVASFLEEHGFELVEHLMADTMQARYLTLRDGSVAGQMLDLFGLVKARVAG